MKVRSEKFLQREKYCPLVRENDGLLWIFPQFSLNLSSVCALSVTLFLVLLSNSMNSEATYYRFSGCRLPLSLSHRFALIA